DPRAQRADAPAGAERARRRTHAVALPHRADARVRRRHQRGAARHHRLHGLRPAAQVGRDGARMDFDFSPEQQELKNAVRQLAARECVPERLLAWESEPTGADEATRRRIAELGWLGVGVPETAGGTGGSLVDLACLLEE